MNQVTVTCSKGVNCALSRDEKQSQQINLVCAGSFLHQPMQNFRDSFFEGPKLNCIKKGSFLPPSCEIAQIIQDLRDSGMELPEDLSQLKAEIDPVLADRQTMATGIHALLKDALGNNRSDAQVGMIIKSWLI